MKLWSYKNSLCLQLDRENVTEGKKEEGKVLANGSKLWQMSEGWSMEPVHATPPPQGPRPCVCWVLAFYVAVINFRRLWHSIWVILMWPDWNWTGRSISTVFSSVLTSGPLPAPEIAMPCCMCVYHLATRKGPITIKTNRTTLKQLQACHHSRQLVGWCQKAHSRLFQFSSNRHHLVYINMLRSPKPNHPPSLNISLQMQILNQGGD